MFIYIIKIHVQVYYISIKILEFMTHHFYDYFKTFASSTDSWVAAAAKIKSAAGWYAFNAGSIWNTSSFGRDWIFSCKKWYRSRKKWCPSNLERNFYHQFSNYVGN